MSYTGRRVVWDIEVWKDVVGFEDRYEVSSLGNVRSKSYLKRSRNANGEFSFYTSPKEMKPTKNHCGYLAIDLRKDRKRATGLVHRLVGEAFLDNPEGLPVINHLDSDRANNCVSNLEWASYQRNVQHSYDCGSNSNLGDKHPRRVLSEDIVRAVRLDYNSGMTMKDIIDKYGFKRDTLRAAITGKNWGHVV